MKPTTFKVGRSDKTGRFTTVKKATQRKSTDVVETIKKKYPLSSSPSAALAGHDTLEEINMVEYTDLPPEAAELIQRQYDIDRADAGPKAPVSGFRYRGVQIESRWAVL